MLGNGGKPPLMQNGGVSKFTPSFKISQRGCVIIDYGHLWCTLVGWRTEGTTRARSRKGTPYDRRQAEGSENIYRGLSRFLSKNHFGRPVFV